MPGSDFYSLEMSGKATRKFNAQKAFERYPIIPVVVVVEPRGKRKPKFTVRRELERQMRREQVAAANLGLKQIGSYIFPNVKWVVLRPVFAATPKLHMAKTNCRIVDYHNTMVLVRKYHGQYTGD